MVKYKHKNIGEGLISVRDDDNVPQLVRPGEEIVLSRKSEGNGIVIVEQVKESKNKTVKEDET